MNIKTILLITLLASTFSCGNREAGKHLFILAGQSNMAGLQPEESFIPTVEKEFGSENIIVIKDAIGGQPIRRWFRDYDPGSEPGNNPQMYDSLMNKIFSAIEAERITDVCFIWMQGERDAREELGDQYKDGLEKIYNQLSKDLDRRDIYFIIGRLSDFDMKNETYPDWTKIRDIQVKFAESYPLSEWVNTDDLNDGINRRGDTITNDLHMSAEGYKILGQRFADKAISLINNK